MTPAEHEKTPLGKFRRQRANARRRFIEWHFTFEEWMEMWQESGQWENRGNKPGQYYMCRKGDVGPYSAANVEIKTISENAKESWAVRRKQPIALDPWRLVERTSAWEYEHTQTNSA
jgi:hypothetical protein